MALWAVVNAFARTLGLAAWDPPPYVGLQTVVSVASLLSVLLVLAAQRHEDELNRQRESLSLELALLAEKKTAKVIQLLEELRRDSPQVRDRRDPAAETMSEPADAEDMMKKIQEAPVAPPTSGS